MFTGVPAGATVPPDVYTVSPDFATLYSINAQRLDHARDHVFHVDHGVSYLYTAGNRLPVYRNINVVPSGTFLADGRPIFGTASRVYPQFGNIFSAESVGHSIYNGANLTLRKQTVARISNCSARTRGRTRSTMRRSRTISIAATSCPRIRPTCGATAAIR